MRRRAIVANHFDLVATGLGVKLYPVDGGRAAHEQQLVLGKVKKNTVADDKTVMAARNICLALPVAKPLKLLMVR